MAKRAHDGGNDEQEKIDGCKSIKIESKAITDNLDKFQGLMHDSKRLVPKNVLRKLSDDDVDLLRNVRTNCTDLEIVQKAIKLRRHHRLCQRLPNEDDDSTYYIKDGLRWVYPYPYIFQTFARRRWNGQKLFNIIKNEFRDLSDERLAERFESNLFLVNGDIAKIDHVIKDNDFICHFIHRHELPVLATPIKVVYEDRETIVINKPPSLPIHPCGRFRHNSILNILKKQYKMNDLKTVHRLDRLVSGILIFAKNSSRAHQLEQAIANRGVQKVYVCRVSGEFPDGDEDDGEVTVEQPLEYVPGKIGVSVVNEHGKPSITKFKRLHYNGKTSAVICKPKTGRMHQIRVHLQYLGHPIVNDYLYNCDAFGPRRGKGGEYGKSLTQLSADILAKHRVDTWLIEDTSIGEDGGNQQIGSSLDIDHENGRIQRFTSEEERKETLDALAGFFSDETSQDLEEAFAFDEAKYHKDTTCRDCTDKYYDPPPRRLFMYLHAMSYTGPNFSYETDLPAWAKESWPY